MSMSMSTDETKKKDTNTCTDTIIELIRTINELPIEAIHSTETWDTLIQTMNHKYCLEIDEYIAHRDIYNRQIKSSVSHVHRELQKLFEHDPNIVAIILMSSYGANTNLVNTSDIDFGLMVKQMDIKNRQRIGQILVTNGYEYGKEMNGYFCYNKMIMVCIDDQDIEIEIEVKVRDYDKSLRVIELHRYIDDKWNEKEKKNFTYLKQQFLQHKKEFPRAYPFIKMLFYNIGLLKIDPECKSFFTNI